LIHAIPVPLLAVA